MIASSTSIRHLRCRASAVKNNFRTPQQYRWASTMMDAEILSSAPQHLPVTWFTEDESMTREAVRQWAHAELRPRVRSMDRNAQMDGAIVTQLFANGYMGLEIDTAHGGSGLSFTAACLVVEELARVDPSVALLVDIHNTLTINAVRFWGSPELQQEWLPRLATDTASAFCLSEANSGSDAFSLQTTATLDGDGDYYILNGTKLWISNAPLAGALLVFANADPARGYKGITAFLIDATTTQGITVGPPEDKLGLRASSTCPLTLDQVRVPSSQILGEVGQGYRYCMEILNEGRIGIAAQQIGIAKACLYDIALPYLHERTQFGRPVADFQAIQHQVAHAATQIYAAETMTYNACRLKEQQQHDENNGNFVQQASMSKYFASRVAEQTASQTIEWLGGIGFTKDLLAEKFYRDCKVGSIYEGTSNIQLSTIAKCLYQQHRPPQS